MSALVTDYPPVTLYTDQFSLCDAAAVHKSIGIGNLWAINDGNAIRRPTGLTFPLSAGFSVTVDRTVGDMFTVRRLFTGRKGRVSIRGELSGVYLDQVGAAAYIASCFRDLAFPPVRRLP